MRKTEKFSFDTSSYAFKEHITKLFDVEDLSLIHQSWKSDYELLDDPETDQNTVYHKTFYEGFDEDSFFYSVYRNFIREQVVTRIDASATFLYQTIPSFRTQLPNNLGVGAFHRDSEYSHSSKEINVYLPMTKVWDTNTIWVESERDKKDYEPMEAEYGEYYIWDGANLMHGNKVNDTGRTRVSIDFRLIRAEDFEDSDKKSISNGTAMTVGGYWSVCM